MFRMSKDFDARVYDEIRKRALLEDEGSHLVALALLKSTIDNVAIKPFQTHQQQPDIAQQSHAATAVQRGIKILQSATENRKEAVSPELASMLQHHREQKAYEQFLARKGQRKQSKAKGTRRDRIAQPGGNDADADGESVVAMFRDDFFEKLESSEEITLSEEVRNQFQNLLDFVVKDQSDAETKTTSSLLLFDGEEGESNLEGLLDDL